MMAIRMDRHGVREAPCAGIVKKVRRGRVLFQACAGRTLRRGRKAARSSAAGAKLFLNMFEAAVEMITRLTIVSPSAASAAMTSDMEARRSVAMTGALGVPQPFDQGDVAIELDMGAQPDQFLNIA